MKSSHYIDGVWQDGAGAGRCHALLSPATEEAIAQVPLAGAREIDAAVVAARRAFPAFSATARAERAALLDSVIAVFKRRMSDLSAAVSAEMGAPMWLAAAAHVPAGLGHFLEARRLLDDHHWEEIAGSTRICREPVGVCALITPWNWPVNQVACKVAPALAAGCTMILKPSEYAPLSATVLAEILAEAGVPAGVFNLVHGDGPAAGAALSAHPLVDMVSFTGSTRGGIAVAQAAAPTVKRVTQELGGKNANIVLDDADLPAAVAAGVAQCFRNSGQSCNAPSRLLVPRAWHDEAARLAGAAADAVRVAAPADTEPGSIGPLANAAQLERVRGFILAGIDEGAALVAGGADRPASFDRGYYVRPTVFASVGPDMIVAREEIFGPVLTIIPYRDEDEAVAIANDTPYGLAAYVQSGSRERARAIAARLRAGSIHLNNAGPDIRAPFGGYKMSGNGREWGGHGLDEYLEVKAVLGWAGD